MRHPYFKDAIAVIIGTLITVIAFQSFPAYAYAQSGLVVCGTGAEAGTSQDSATGCQACHLFQLIDRIVKFLILIAVPIASLLFAYAGFLYITAGGGHGVDEAKAIFKDVLIGFVIALCGFLIVDTILRSLVNGSFAGPSWNTIQCTNKSVASIFGSGIGFGALPNLGGLVVGEPTAQPQNIVVSDPGTVAGIAQAAGSYQGMSTSAGPDGGNLACAWAVNNILTTAGYSPIDGDSVPQMENVLKSGRGSLVDQSSAAPGDIVIRNDDGHVGICMNAGCSQVISNSSSKAAFSNVTSSDFGSGVPSRIYRVSK